MAKRAKTEGEKCLADLVATVAAAIWLIDHEMNKPSTVERGRKIADILNKLELQNDLAMHNTLGYSVRKMNKLKGKKSLAVSR